MIEEIRRRLKNYKPDTDEAHSARQKAAVLVPVIQNASGPGLLLTERSTNLGSHAGEVAFPGGKEDEADDSLTATALRETEEEVGLGGHQVELVGELRPFVSKFGLLVTPYVGLVRPGITYRANPDEIASIFEVPIAWILEDQRIRTDVISRHGETHHVPAYDYDGYEIWGLTSMILSEFLNAGLGRTFKDS